MEKELGAMDGVSKANCARQKAPAERKGSCRGEVGAKSWQVTC